ncbi:MAG TPA: ABC transporter permease [Anaerolineales bacterium]|nr:ABC transporter permease [Anaerolineales bacterium]
MERFSRSLREITRYPSAIGGALIILFLVGLSIYTMITIPYQEAIRLWRGGQDVWYHNPPTAPPVWINYFRRDKLPETFSIQSEEAEKTIKETGDGREINIAMPFDYSFDSFPQELMLYFSSSYSEKQPYVSIMLHTPDGRDVRIADFAVDRAQTYIFSQDTRLTRRLKGLPPRQGIFLNPESGSATPVKGQYTLNLKVITFEKDADVKAEFIVYGQVAGWAGTDHQRRDIGVALLWGTPIALAFGLLAALGTTVTTMFIAAVGVWYAGWVDSIIQRITEVNLVLPFLSILIMVGAFYSRSIWVILGVTILLGIFGGSIITYRSVFMQVKESPYIEAARAYGAGNMRIILFYLIPRIIPLLIPQLVTLIPTYVFLESSLSVLGLGDPVLPTWGKVITDAIANGALFQNQYYWVLEPAFLLMLTGLAFAMLGFVLDRIFNPKLRGL